MRDKRHVFLMLLCIALLIVDGLLLLTLNKCKAVSESYLRKLGATPGTRVSALRGTDLQGKPIVVPVTGQRKSVILVFSQNCGYCKKNWPNWRSLLDSIGGVTNVAFVNLTPQLDEAYIAENRMQRYQVIARVESASKQEYRLNVTPQTLLIGSDGVIERVWTGELDGKALAEIRRTVGAVDSGAR